MISRHDGAGGVALLFVSAEISISAYRRFGCHGHRVVCAVLRVGRRAFRNFRENFKARKSLSKMNFVKCQHENTFSDAEMAEVVRKLHPPKIVLPT